MLHTDPSITFLNKTLRKERQMHTYLCTTNESFTPNRYVVCWKEQFDGETVFCLWHRAILRCEQSSYSASQNHPEPWLSAKWSSMVWALIWASSEKEKVSESFLLPCAQRRHVREHRKRCFRRSFHLSKPQTSTIHNCRESNIVVKDSCWHSDVVV